MEDTEEMKGWRRLDQSEMDLCWKNLAQRMEEEVLDKYKVEESKKGAFKGRSNPMEKSAQKQEIRNKKVKRGLLGETFLLVQASAKQAGGANRRGGDEVAAKDGNHGRSEKEN